MSVLNPVLYGRRLYARTLYAWNFDVETFNLVFNDGIGLAEQFNDQLDKVLADVITLTDEALKTVEQQPLIDSITLTDAITTSFGKALNDTITVTDSTITTTGTKGLNDSITLGESFITNFTKVLADTITLTDAQLFAITRTLNDSILVEDSTILTTMTVALDDILLLQDWISIRLSKPNLWSVQQQRVPVSSLYGIILYGRSLYSGSGGTPWETLKPSFSKGPTNGKPNSWKSYNELEEHN
jgi:hypothetical protein